MLRHLLIGVLIGLIASAGGCAAPGFVVRSDRGRAPVEFQRVRPVEYAKEDLQQAVEPYGEHLAAVIRQHEGQLHLRLASTPGAPADPWQQAALVDPYLGWCARRGAPGDCLSVLDAGTSGLSVDAKRTIALRMALASGLEEAAEVIRNIDPVKVEATLVIWFAIYLATLVFPEAMVTKALFVIMTANLIAFLGVDGFRNIIQGYRQMAAEVDAAQTFDQLRDAGDRYGRRMGPSMLRIVTALVTWGVGAATGMVRPVTSLPGGTQAVANAQAQGFNLLAVSSGSVTVSASGSVTLVLAAQATIPGAGGTSGEQPSEPEFTVAKHGQMLTPRPGQASHHGVISVWLSKRFPKYDPNRAPAILMPKGNHEATFAVFNRWRALARERMGGVFDWRKVSEEEMRSLSEQMFDAAKVPAKARAEYWAEFERMKAALERPHRGGDGQL